MVSKENRKDAFIGSCARLKRENSRKVGKAACQYSDQEPQTPKSELEFYLFLEINSA